MGTQPFHPPSPGTTFAVWGPLAVPSFAANTQAECNAQAQLASPVLVFHVPQRERFRPVAPLSVSQERCPGGPGLRRSF